MLAAIAADILAGGGAPDEVFRLLRIPRTLTAVAACAALALSGAQMQAVFRNPLADPHIMGISSGAGLGAALVTLAGGSAAGFLPGISLAAAASAGALAISLLVILISRRIKGTYTLLVFGVLTGFAVNAVVSVLQSWADPESLRLFYSWSAGTFINCGYPEIALICAATVTGAAVAFRISKGLDILLFGDEFAALSGAAPGSVRWMSLTGCCIMTGCVTAFCGPIGFAGIVAPHIARKVTGTSVHRTVLAASLFIGGTAGALADLISQTAPAPVPAGSTMALAGIPVIIYIMLKRKPATVSAGEDRTCKCAGCTASQDGDPVLRTENLSIGYGDNVLCSEIDIEIHRGDCILLCGANGSGKTTLLRTLASQCNMTNNDKVAMIPSGIPKVKGFSLEEFIDTGCFTLSDSRGRMPGRYRKRLREVMDRMHILDLKGRDISTLSDGEFQKGCIAAALCRDSDIILLDEPTAYLDPENRIEVLSALKEISVSYGKAVVFSSHDIKESIRFCNRVAAIGADCKFRISSYEGPDSGDRKMQTALSIFRNKNINFEV